MVLTTGMLQAQKKEKGAPVKWESYDFSQNKFKVTGGAFKKLKKHDTYIANFSVQQMTEAQGELTNKQKFRNGVQIKSSVALSGVDNEMMQALTQQLYTDFTQNLQAAGVNLVDGKKVINNEFVKSKVAKLDMVYSGSGVLPAKEMSLKEPVVGALGNGLGTIYFHPDYNYLIDSRYIGNGYYRMAMKSKTNIITVNYLLTFADFSGSAGYSTSSLQTRPLITVQPVITIYTPEGLIGTAVYNKLIYGNRKGWMSEKGMKEAGGSENIFGTVKKVGYVMYADNEKYKQEIRKMLNAVQGDVLQHIKDGYL